MPDVPYGFCHCGCGERTRLADRNYHKRGIVKDEPQRFIHGHHSRRRRPGPLYIVLDCGYPTPCWVWLRYTNPKGYGQMSVDGRPRLAHRVFYERANGPIPDGLEPDHLCRVPSCVNPDHLEPVTATENKRRGLTAKLTPAQVLVIRARLANGDTHRAIGADYGVAHSTIGNIARGFRWVDVV